MGIIFSPLGALQAGVNIAALAHRGSVGSPSRLQFLRGQLPKMELHNLVSGEWLRAQYNPAELEETVGVEWQKQSVVGMSHKPLQYTATDNAGFGFELVLDALEEVQANRQAKLRGVDYLEDARRFLLHLCYAPKTTKGVRGAAPPRVLFYWPRFISLTCVVTQLSFRYTRFSNLGQPVATVCKVSLSEIRDVRLTSEEVRKRGSLREPNPLEGR